MKRTYADMPALLEDLNLEETFAGVYGRSSKAYISEYKPDAELIQSVLNDLQVETTGLIISDSGITLESAIVRKGVTPDI